MLNDGIPEELISAPAHLRASVRKFFDHVVSGAPEKYDAPSRVLLIRYCEVWDQLLTVQEQREQKKIGFYYTDRFGSPRIHPLVKAEKDLTNELGKLYRLLGWDLAPPNDDQGSFPWK